MRLLSLCLLALTLTACQHSGNTIPYQASDVQPSLVEQNQAKLDRATTF